MTDLDRRIEQLDREADKLIDQGLNERAAEKTEERLRLEALRKHEPQDDGLCQK